MQLGVGRLMRKMGEIGPFRSDAAGHLDRFRNALVGGMGPPPERAQHQNAHAGQQFDGCIGQPFDVGDVPDTTDPIPEYRGKPVIHSHRLDGEAPDLGS